MNANPLSVLSLTRKERRAEVRRLYFRLQMPMQRIARKLGVSRYTIWRDVRLWRQQDPSLGCRNPVPTMDELYREIEELKQEAWRAYGRSLEPQVVVTETWSRPATKPASLANSSLKRAQRQGKGSDTVVSAKPDEPALVQSGTQMVRVDTQLQQNVTGVTRCNTYVRGVDKSTCGIKGVPNQMIGVIARCNGSSASAPGPPRSSPGDGSHALTPVKRVAFSV